MSEITLILNYEDGKEPKLCCHQEILGGKLVGFAWSNLQEKIEVLEDKIEQLEQENGN